MILLAYAVLFGLPLSFFGTILRHRGSPRSVAFCLVFGWLCMPRLAIGLPALPDLDKVSVLGVSVFSAAWIARRATFRMGSFRWFDVPIILWCLSGLASSLSNDTGAYDGVATVLRQALAWGVPYALGRLVFNDRKSLVDLGIALLVGSVFYAPLCLVESRMGPQLHAWIYGLPGRAGWEQVGFYGPLRWKASVFLESPLELTPLMGIGSLYGYWLWKYGNLKSVGGYSARIVVAIAFVAALMGKSLGGISLTLGSGLILGMGRWTKSRLPLFVFMSLAPAYVLTRSLGLWSGSNFVAFLEENVSASRAGSFAFRLANEELLLVKALERPLFGWGGWGRNLVYDEDGSTLTIVDGHWIIILGACGLFGLIAWITTLLLPAALTIARFRTRHHWTDPSAAAVLVAAIALVMHSIDCVANAMPSLIYPMIAGALGSVAASGERQTPRAAEEAVGRPSRGLLHPRGETPEKNTQ